MMKKILLLLLLVSFVLNLKAQNQPKEKDFSKGINENYGNYLSSEYKGNYVWAGAMNLAWNELNETILHEKLKLNSKDKVALQMVEALNNPIFTKNDLDEKSYYIKSGYGQKTVTVINKESRKKFPNKSFEDLSLKLSDTDIISYAYFLKETEYKNVFEKGIVSFNGIKVQGFMTANKTQRDNVKVLSYENDDKFIIRLQLKDDSDYLILAKGYPSDNPQSLIKEINASNKVELKSLNSNDIFSAPAVRLSHYREYRELINKSLLNKGFESYQIQKMFENIKFNMDEKGARVENEAVIVLGKSLNIDDEKPRKFELNKAFWVVMQRKGSPNPYFLLGINNTELMVAK